MGGNEGRAGSTFGGHMLRPSRKPKGVSGS